MERRHSRRGIIYCRTDPHSKSEDSHRQTAQCLRYARRHGIAVVAVYEDEGASGLSRHRLALAAAFQAMGQRPTDVLLIADWDRLSRSAADLITLCNRAATLNVEIRTTRPGSSAEPALRLPTGTLRKLNRRLRGI